MTLSKTFHYLIQLIIVFKYAIPQRRDPTAMITNAISQPVI